MQSLNRAKMAYGAAAARRDLRDQEADVFRRVNGALAAARGAGPLERARALSDNARLWLSVTDLVRSPDNTLPVPLRVSLASVGATVQRETAAPQPDWDFLIAVNENIAAGLSGDGLR